MLHKVYGHVEKKSSRGAAPWESDSRYSAALISHGGLLCEVLIGQWHACCGERLREKPEIQRSCERPQDRRLRSETLRKRYPSGMLAYFSDELEEFQIIARHYEQLGTLLRLRCLPPDLLNTIIPFPDEFWEGTKELRAYVGTICDYTMS
jgi:hypothetical protein